MTTEPETGPEFFWYLVSHDGPYPWEPAGRYDVGLPELRDLARTIDRLGYQGALVATTGHDVWVLGTAAATVTDRFSPLLAVRPQFVSATAMANMAISFDNLFDDRLILNVINSETPIWRQNGIWLENDERYDLHLEYWEVFNRLVAGETVTYHGRYLQIENATANPWLRPRRSHVPLWFSGSSDKALDVAARFADAYLTFAEPDDRLTAKIADVHDRAAAFARRPRIGLRASVITGATDADAWAAADRLLAATSQETYRRKLGLIDKGGNAGGRSVTQSRIFDLIPRDALAELRTGQLPRAARQLSFDETLWPGIALLQQGPPVALVGGYQTIIDRIRSYQRLGVDIFILDALPLRRGAEEVAANILPAFAPTGRVTTESVDEGEAS